MRAPKKKTLDIRKAEEIASLWVARHERGLSAVERDQFQKWISEDPENEEIFFECQIEWHSLDMMDEWEPSISSTPEPDLFVSSKVPLLLKSYTLIGFAAVVLFVLAISPFFKSSKQEITDLSYKSYVASKNEKHFLDDGSSFYLRSGSELRIAYNSNIRSILFISGEALFEVAKDPVRPFVVQADTGKVTAVGTAFSVRHDELSFEVFVTEGRVKIDSKTNIKSKKEHALIFSSELDAGHKLTQSVNDGTFDPDIDKYSDLELQQRLSWRDGMIEMVSAPLIEIIDEFKRFDQSLVIHLDEDIEHVPLSVSIRSDNLDDFLELLEITMDVTVSYSDSGEITIGQ